MGYCMLCVKKIFTVNNGKMDKEFRTIMCSFSKSRSVFHKSKYNKQAITQYILKYFIGIKQKRHFQCEFKKKRSIEKCIILR